MTMKNLNGDGPQIVRNPEGPGIKRLFYSESALALRKDKVCSGGYGYLKAGTVMAVNASTIATSGGGELVPYTPISTAITIGTDSAIGVSPAVATAITTAFYVSLADSYKYKVGDLCYADNDSDEGPDACGAITAIDRTTSTLMAGLTFASVANFANYTVAKGSYIYVKTFASDPFTAAFAVLDKDVNTGYGEDAAGANAPVILSNAILYTGSLVNMTAAAVTTLGVVQDGQHTILK